MLTETVGIYLVTIFRLTQGNQWAKTGNIAAMLDIRLSSVSEMLKRLDRAGYVTHQSRIGVKLTPKGRKIALNRVRKHRLLKTLLVETIGYELDEVYGEASRLEHVVSDQLIDRVDQLLGYPCFDPHGYPIPDRDGVMAETAYVPLSDIEVGDVVTICQVEDSPPEKISYLCQLSLIPGEVVQVLERAPLRGPIKLSVNDNATAIAVDLAQEIKVELSKLN